MAVRRSQSEGFGGAVALPRDESDHLDARASPTAASRELDGLSYAVAPGKERTRERLVAQGGACDDAAVRFDVGSLHPLHPVDRRVVHDLRHLPPIRAHSLIDFTTLRIGNSIRPASAADRVPFRSSREGERVESLRGWRPPPTSATSAGQTNLADCVCSTCGYGVTCSEGSRLVPQTGHAKTDSRGGIYG